MSNIGLNSNIYQSTRTYLDLLNNFLVDVNYALEKGEPYSTYEVIDFLKKINEETNLDPEVQLMRSFFNRFYKERSKKTENELAKIISHLENSNLDKDTIKEIESLVKVLKFQNAQSYTRMKGIK
jgi:hypothetical protein